VTVRLLASALLLAAVPAAGAQPAPSVRGATLQLELRTAGPLSGELLAVEGDSLVLLAGPRDMRRVALGDVLRARVPRPGMSARGVLAWTVVGGLVSGALLTGACASLDDTSGCGAVLPAVALTWGVFGGLSAAVAGSGWRVVTMDAATLTPYARFPQGLPEGFGRGTDGS
jgi:hypothetical protein